MSRRLAWVATAVAAAVLAFLSLHPHPESIVPIVMWDKAEHFLAYSTLAIILGHAVFLTLPAREVIAAAATVLGATLFGVLMEILQHFFPPRTPDVWDAVANAIGACMGIVLFFAGRAALRPVAVRIGAAALLLLAAACGGAPPRAQERAALLPIERLLVEEAALRSTHPDEDVRQFYAAIEARSIGEERRVYGYLLARLEPERAARRRAYEALLAASPPFQEAALALGDLAFEDGDRRVALAFWDRGDARSARIMARRALLLDDRELARRALAAYDAAPVKAPDGFFAAAALALHEPDRAERLLNESWALGLEDAAGGLERGLARLAAGDADGASRAFERAIALGTTRTVPRGAYVKATLTRLAAWLRRGPSADAEELALLAALRFPDVAAFHHAGALAALLRGDEALALHRARRALAADPAEGGAVRLARLLLVRAGRVEEAYETWFGALPAGRIFGEENDLLARMEALRDAVKNPPDRPALARAFAACGLFEEAQAIGPGDAQTAGRIELARAVHRALGALGPEASVADGLAALREAAPGLAIEAREGEAGTLATPDGPLVRALFDAGLVLELRRGDAGLTARLLVLVSARRRALDGAPTAWELVGEAADAALATPTGLLGRASPLASGFVLYLDQIRPPAADVLDLAIALREPRSSLPAPPSAPPDAIATSAALRAELIRRAAAPLLAPLDANGDDGPARVYEALLEARLRYVGDHESGHLVDLARLLPLAAHPLTNLARVLGGGVAPADVAARYEEVAELYALARGSAPYVALLSIQGALSDIDAPREEALPVARAAAEAVFRALRDDAREMLKEPHASLARAIAALDPPAIRSIARRRLAEEGLAVGGPP